MSQRLLSILCTTLLLVGSVFAATKLLENIPLVWKPTDTLGSSGPLNLGGAVISTALHVDTLVDTRNNPSMIAENQENPDKPLPVTTSGDVAAFVTDHMKDSLHVAGLNIVDGPGDMTLSGEIRQFFVTETSTYRSDLSLVMHLKDAHGKEVWSGAVAGGTERFGRGAPRDAESAVEPGFYRRVPAPLTHISIVEWSSHVHIHSTARTPGRGRHAISV
jgi:hypothetical protein